MDEHHLLNKLETLLHEQDGSDSVLREVAELLATQIGLDVHTKVVELTDEWDITRAQQRQAEEADRAKAGAWQQRIEHALKGAAALLERVLSTAEHDGYAHLPLYTEIDAFLHPLDEFMEDDPAEAEEV